MDSWNLSAWLKEQERDAALMSDLWEKALRRENKVLEDMRAWPLAILSIPDSLVWKAARIKAQFPISYADAFAAATATATGCPLVTGDPEMRLLESAGLVSLAWAGA